MASALATDEMEVTPEELQRAGGGQLPGSPVVHVEKVEKEFPRSPHSPTAKQHEHRKPAAKTHETEKIKTTVEVEDENKASFMDKMKGKVRRMEDKLKPRSAVHAQQHDPHPAIH